MFKFLNIFRRKKKVVPSDIVSLPLPDNSAVYIKGTSYFDNKCKNPKPSFNLSPITEEPGNWQTASVECPLCTKRWTAVWPVATINIECPNCANMIEPIITDVP